MSTARDPYLEIPDLAGLNLAPVKLINGEIIKNLYALHQSKYFFTRESLLEFAEQILQAEDDRLTLEAPSLDALRRQYPDYELSLRTCTFRSGGLYGMIINSRGFLRTSPEDADTTAKTLHWMANTLKEMAS